MEGESGVVVGGGYNNNILWKKKRAAREHTQDVEQPAIMLPSHMCVCK